MKKALQTSGQRIDEGWCQELEIKHMCFTRNRSCAQAGSRFGETCRFRSQILHFPLDQL